MHFFTRKCVSESFWNLRNANCQQPQSANPQVCCHEFDCLPNVPWVQYASSTGHLGACRVYTLTIRILTFWTSLKHSGTMTIIHFLSDHSPRVMEVPWEVSGSFISPTSGHHRPYMGGHWYSQVTPGPWLWTTYIPSYRSHFHHGCHPETNCRVKWAMTCQVPAPWRATVTESLVEHTLQKKPQIAHWFSPSQTWRSFCLSS